MSKITCFPKKFSGGLAAKIAIAAVLWLTPAVRAEMHEVRVQLRDGKLSLPELSAALSTKLGLPAIEYGSASVDVQGMGSSLAVVALNKALGHGCNVSVDRDAVIVRIDPAQLPHSMDEAKLATRTFTATAVPDATAKQALKYGLLLPPDFKDGQRLVVLLHGVDCTRDCLQPLADLLRADGYQVGFFGYPDDQPIADSGALFTEHLTAVRGKFTSSPIDVVAFSMGGLVARSTIEGPAYPGGVNRLILLAPPNGGSSWAHVRFVLEAREQWQQWQHDKDWSPSWMITDGMGEAGRDLLPASAFLKTLNDRPRRDGVAYTIVNGNVNPIRKAVSGLASSAVATMGPTIAAWTKADVLADGLRDRRDESDGPVTQASTALPGVTDVVTVEADHNGLYLPHDGNPPAAWAVIHDRLK